MTRRDNLYELPNGLPVPVDDGACRHLPGICVPSVTLKSTKDRHVNIASLQGRTIVYCYPRTGRPDIDPPSGWDEIPGARGCTPQACAFRDHYGELKALGVELFGLSTQDSDYQQEAVARLHLPFELLSDSKLELTRALSLPTFVVAGMTLLKRLTFVIEDGRVGKVFYPIFPPHSHAKEVVDWLSGVTNIRHPPLPPR